MLIFFYSRLSSACTAAFAEPLQDWQLSEICSGKTGNLACPEEWVGPRSYCSIGIVITSQQVYRFFNFLWNFNNGFQLPTEAGLREVLGVLGLGSLVMVTWKHWKPRFVRRWCLGCLHMDMTYNQSMSQCLKVRRPKSRCISYIYIIDGIWWLRFVDIWVLLWFSQRLPLRRDTEQLRSDLNRHETELEVALGTC